MTKLLLKAAFIAIIAWAVIAGTISLIWGYETADKFKLAIGFAMAFTVFVVYMLNKSKDEETL